MILCLGNRLAPIWKQPVVSVCGGVPALYRRTSIRETYLTPNIYISFNIVLANDSKKFFTFVTYMYSALSTTRKGRFVMLLMPCFSFLEPTFLIQAVGCDLTRRARHLEHEQMDSLDLTNIFGVSIGVPSCWCQGIFSRHVKPRRSGIFRIS